ncbi:phage tail tape measure protein [Haemophilus paraphrohaemolyticus]|uniref:phage tail tape measure protein n=1 Tax=Haemophilus paraphrohaemolyticus TaxID=736 RepID=UPI0028E35319|nr:phage tail tape measure protein [Haemophilus paraphrohaemolyticus]
MANNLAIGLVIGASLAGSFKSSFAGVNGALDKLGQAVAKNQKIHSQFSTKLNGLRSKQAALYAEMSRASSKGGVGLALMKAEYDKLGKAISQVSRQQREFSKELNRSLKAQQKLQGAVSGYENAKNKRDELKGKALGTLASATVGVGVMKTYMQQEEAANSLKISMMKADGTFGKFNKIGKIADQLGTDLPGTRQDFYKLAKAMKMQGVSDDTLINGGLKTSAKLNVLLEMDQEQGGEFFSKMMESHGLSEAELGASADDLQRAMFAAGMKKDDMYGAMTYYASNIRSMKLTGQENSQKIFAIEGLAAQQGLEGTSFGTNFSTMLDRMSKGPQMIAEAKKGMKAEARDILEKSGVKFDFWDKKGNFKGIDGMVKELEKLQKIRAKFGDQAAQDVADAMFGTEGKRVALLLGEKGTAGLQDFLQKMKDQASLEERVAQKTKMLGSALESLGGAWESAVGNVGSVFADDIKSFSKSLQEAVEWFTPFISQHKQAVKFVLGLVAGFVALRGVLQVGSFAIQTVTMAMNALKIATMTNPIGLIIGAIALGAFLIYQYWEPISAWFSEKWSTISGIFSSAWNSISYYCSEVWASITAFFGSGIGNITATILNWSPLGLFQQVFSTVLSWFGIDMPAKFTEFGSNLINGLVNGIRNTWDGAKEWVIGLGKSIKGWFTGEMEIHSPSRVFKGYGQNIVEGLAIGMDKAEPLARDASKNLSSAVKFEPALNGIETAFKPILNEKKGFFGSLWDDIKFGANFVGNLLGINQPVDYRTPDFNPNSSGQNPSIFHDYQPLNRNAVTNNETNQHNGIMVNFNPTIHVGGNQTQGVMEQVQQGLNMSLVEFERLLNRVLDQRQRRAY